MADVRPLNALHYDLAAVGSLQDVVAPPYDVIDSAQRAELLERSPYNAVAIDLPKPYDETGPEASGEGDPYERAAEAIEAWRQAGALVDDPEEEPWGEATTDMLGTVTRVWRIGDPGVHDAVTELLADSQLLIADGHHRYETAIAYRDEVGGEGPHNYTLMALTGLDDPGLTVFPTHRLLSGFAGDPERQQRLGNGLRELFDVTEVDVADLDPIGQEGVGVFDLYDSHHKRGFRLRLKDTATLDRQLEGKPEAYRRLDAAILETLVLKGIAGMSEDDILAKRGIGYAKSVDDSLALLEDGSYDVAFILRPIPVDQVRAICESDENMPPKSTYFFPKVPSGLVFNPVG